MTQRISGAYRLVTIPSIHKALMFSLGAGRAATRYVNEVLQPAPGMKMLDVGCGSANIIPYLPPLDYTGIDLNEKHIGYARQRHGNGARFIVGNAAVDLKPNQKQFDLINVSGLLHHITDDEAVSLFASLTALVKPNGRIVTIDAVWLPKQRVAVRLANHLDSGTNIRAPEGYLRLLNGTGLDVHTLIWNDLLRIPYDHFIMIARKAS